MVSVMIRVVQFIGAEFFQRVIRDPEIPLRDRLQSDIILRNVAKIGLVWNTGLLVDSYGILVLIA